MNQTWVQVVRGTDMPDLIVADNTYWRLYLESMQAIQRVTNEKMTQAGFMNLKYMNADVVFDSDGGAPANVMYFLNTDFIFYRPHVNRNMVPLENKTSINQDAMVVPLLWVDRVDRHERTPLEPQCEYGCIGEDGVIRDYPYALVLDVLMAEKGAHSCDMPP